MIPRQGKQRNGGRTGRRQIQGAPKIGVPKAWDCLRFRVRRLAPVAQPPVSFPFGTGRPMIVASVQD